MLPSRYCGPISVLQSLGSLEAIILTIFACLVTTIAYTPSKHFPTASTDQARPPMPNAAIAPAMPITAHLLFRPHSNESLRREGAFVTFTVASNGTVAAVQVDGCSDAAAIWDIKHTLEASRFTPGFKNGRPTPWVLHMTFAPIY
jgi:hypothetical protein